MSTTIDGSQCVKRVSPVASTLGAYNSTYNRDTNKKIKIVLIPV